MNWNMLYWRQMSQEVDVKYITLHAKGERQRRLFHTFSQQGTSVFWFHEIKDLEEQLDKEELDLLGKNHILESMQKERRQAKTEEGVRQAEFELLK